MIFNRLLRRIRPSATPDRANADRVFDLTWSIPEDFGGLTKVMLRRSRNFVTRLGLGVDVLTLDYRLDVNEARARLRASGELIDGMELRNAWAEVAAFDRRQLRTFGGTATGAGIPAAPDSLETRSCPQYVEYLDMDGQVVRVDHLRADGSVCVVDDRTGEKRRLVLVDPAGRYVSEFTRARDFYFAWLDAAIGSDDAVLINESKYIATFLYHYRRDHIRIGQVLHNSHLNPRSSSPNGPFTKSRLGILNHWFDYDFIIFLTEKQKADFVRAFGDSPTLVVIPNSTAVGTASLSAHDDRTQTRGAVVARLTGQKRVDHALSAVSAVGPEITLDIFGDGDKRTELERLVEEDETLERRAVFRGHVDGAADQLDDFSFILLTSSFEGMGVVLIEAMARGCVPIAYDIRYGPSDIIDSGENGFLVRDREQMTTAITDLIDRDTEAMKQLRGAAVEKARTFSDESVTERWSQLFSWLAANKKVRPQRKANPERGTAHPLPDGGVAVTVSARTGGSNSDDVIAMRTRDGYYAFASAIDEAGTGTFTGDELAVLPSDAILDVWLQTAGRHGIERHRIAWAGDDDEVAIGRLTAYRTVKDNLSLKVG